MLLSRNSPLRPKKKPLVKRPWTDVQSKPSVTSVSKKKPKILSAAVKPKTAAKKPTKARKLPPPKSRKALPIRETLERLREAYPDAHCELDHRNAFELLAATILSAQCTDVRVNMVTPELFRRFPTPLAMSEAPLEELEELVRTTGFFKNKAKSLKGMATAIVTRHAGEVPRRLEELVELSGVGRKTANVVLGNAFGIASGVVVDTHVSRISQRFGWVKGGSAEAIERELNEMIPRADWIMTPHLLIFHGRRVCKAPTPRCEECFLFDACPRREVK